MRTKRQQPGALPEHTINGVRYFVDWRLRELRSVNNPHDRLPLAAMVCTVPVDFTGGTAFNPAVKSV